MDDGEVPYEGDYGAEEDLYTPKEEFTQNPDETDMGPGFESELEPPMPPDESEGAQPMA